MLCHYKLQITSTLQYFKHIVFTIKWLSEPKSSNCIWTQSGIVLHENLLPNIVFLKISIHWKYITMQVLLKKHSIFFLKFLSKVFTFYEVLVITIWTLPNTYITYSLDRNHYKTFLFFRLAQTYSMEMLDSMITEPAKCGACGAPAAKRCSRCKNEWYCRR